MKVIDKIGYSLVRQVKNIDWEDLYAGPLALSLFPSPWKNISIDC